MFYLNETKLQTGDFIGKNCHCKNIQYALVMSLY